MRNIPIDTTIRKEIVFTRTLLHLKEVLMKGTAAEFFAMIVSGEMDELMEQGMKTFNVKLDFNHSSQIEAFSRKTGMNKSEVIRKFLDAGIEAVWKELDEKTKSEMESLLETITDEIIAEAKSNS